MLLHYANKTRWAELKEHHADVNQLCFEAIDREMQCTRDRGTATLPAVEAEAVTAVVLYLQSLCEEAQQSKVSAMTIQRRLKSGLELLSKQLNRH